MSHKVNAEGFRLGISRFWKSELFSSYFSNFIQRFLAIYLLLKKKLNSFFFKIVFFKLVFLKKNKVLVLVNVYKLIKAISNSSKRPKDPAIEFKQKTGKKNKQKKKTRLNPPTQTKTFFQDKLKGLVAVKLFSKKKKVKQQPRSESADARLFKVKTLFSNSRLQLRFFSFQVERFLFKTLGFVSEVKLKNIFTFKLKHIKSKVNPLGISKVVYKQAKTFWKLRRFLYLKDAINIFSLSFFYNKSELLANYIADIIRLRRKFLFELRNLKSILPFFQKCYFSYYKASLKINILGKILGQRRRRFRCFTLKEGFKFSTQDINMNLSYSLAQSWNIFGSFGVKVWIYKPIKKISR